MISNLLLTINIVLPVFLVMVTGYICRQIKLVSAENVKTMNRLVFRVFLPVSLGKSLMNMKSGLGGHFSMMVFCMAGILCCFAAAMILIPRLIGDNSRRSVWIQSTFRTNTAIMGIPLAESLFPQGDGGASAMMIMATVPLFNALAVLTFEVFRGGKPNFKKILWGILKNPLIWGCAIGFIIGRLPFALPQFALSTIDKLAGMASPLALFSLGATIDLKKLGGNMRPLACAVGARLILIPAILLEIAYLAGFRGPEFAALMLAFATPCAVSSYTMASEMGGDEELAAQIVMMTTVLSSLSVFLMIFIFKMAAVF